MKLNLIISRSLFLLPVFAIAGMAQSAEERSPNAIGCSVAGHLSYRIEYPCFQSTGWVFRLDHGAFEYYGEIDHLLSQMFEKKHPELQFGEANGYLSWEKTAVSKLPSGKVSVTTEISGNIGVAFEYGSGALCDGEVSSYENTVLRDRILAALSEDGNTLSPARLHDYALLRAVSACEDAKGTVVMDGDKPLIVDAQDKSENRIRQGGTGIVRKWIPVKRKCLSSSVRIKCDLSNRAEEMAKLYREFQKEYPENPWAKSAEFELFR
jgi:hypothetical protein